MIDSIQIIIKLSEFNKSIFYLKPVITMSIFPIIHTTSTNYYIVGDRND
ncbi:MAG: hypothetical protein PF693_00740 [Spirochaetia bacterium]|jgi:hypothetical protein|nr:hypothetical protein [Spirochaetia bacterium]